MGRLEEAALRARLDQLRALQESIEAGRVDLEELALQYVRNEYADIERELNELEKE